MGGGCDLMEQESDVFGSERNYYPRGGGKIPLSNT